MTSTALLCTAQSLICTELYCSALLCTCGHAGCDHKRTLPACLHVQFFCPACGIATTSQANLQDHLSGRKHARRVQHLAKVSTMPPLPSSTLASGKVPKSQDTPVQLCSNPDLPTVSDLCLAL